MLSSFLNVDTLFEILVSLSKDIFKRRTSTGSGLFSFLDAGFAQIWTNRLYNNKDT